MPTRRTGEGRGRAMRATRSILEPGSLGMMCLVLASWSVAPAGAQEATDMAARDSVCEADAERAENLGLVGVVRDAETRLPLPDARVTLSLPPGSVPDTASPRRSTRSGTDGRFRFCGLPAGQTAELRASKLSRSSGKVTVSLDRGAVPETEIKIRLGMPGRLMGEVRSQQTGARISAADVRLPALGLAAATGDDGKFKLAGVPPGKYEVEVSHLSHGTRRDSVRIRSGKTVRVAVAMATEPVELDPLTVEVTGVRYRWLEANGFYRRMNRSAGHFITREQIEERDPARLIFMMRGISGVQIRGDHLVMNRAPTSMVTGRRCRLQYFVNGQSAKLPLGINTFEPEDVAGIEVYRGASELPMMFNEARSACGAVAVWLRSRR